MHTRVKVRDLNLRQWDHLTTEVPVNGREFLDGLPRLCVEFELAPEVSSLHIEMDVAEFATIMTRIESIRNEPAVAEVAQAALTPDALPDHLEGVRNAADPQRAAERSV
jgi:hypothetical protein